jgi:hypothetical protein
MSLAALPVMRAQGHGRIVNITSIGGKVSVPHLLAYSTAKFAAVGFSEGLRAELSPGPVTVTALGPRPDAHLLAQAGPVHRAPFTGRPRRRVHLVLPGRLAAAGLDRCRTRGPPDRGRCPGAAARGHLDARWAACPPAPPASAPGLTSRTFNGAQRLLFPPQAIQASGPVPGQQLCPVLRRDAFAWLTGLGRTAARRSITGRIRPAPSDASGDASRPGIQRPSALASCALFIDERPLTPRLRASAYSCS